MRTLMTAAAIAAALAGGALVQAKQTPHAMVSRAAIAAAVANPSRADQASDDASRKPADLIAFAGVHPGDVVIDFIPGGGYWTRIFTNLVGPKGHVYSTWPQASVARSGPAMAALTARGLANVTATGADDLPSSVRADLFWTFENYHDIANTGGEAALAVFNKRVFDLLKPGGVYLIGDHADAAGKGLADTNTLHRIDPATVKAQVTAAGFRYESESKVLRNPQDDHTLGVRDPGIRYRTDRFVFKFRKPA